jgi:hypothetical protein
MFNDDLIIKDVGVGDGGRSMFVLRYPLRWRTALNGGGGAAVTVPVGFKTDFASVPRLLWPLCPPSGRWTKAAVVHDYLCETGECSRFLADAIFREIMRELKVPLWRRVVMYYAVRAYAVLTRK